MCRLRLWGQLGGLILGVCGYPVGEEKLYPALYNTSSAGNVEQPAKVMVKVP